MLNPFSDLSDDLCTQLQGDEVLTLFLRGEESDFVRFNKGTVRQAGHVQQATLELDLIDGARHASARITLSGDPAIDRDRAANQLSVLRDLIPYLPEDPYLLYSKDVQSTDRTAKNQLPESGEVVDSILGECGGSDLVGIYASGAIHTGFANSLGQRNLFTTDSFHFDWSFYHQADKAVKCGYAGTEWEPEAFQRKVESGRRQLGVIERSPRTIEPGRYRAYLAPTALYEILSLMCWGGFGLKAQRTKRSPLLRAVEGEAHLKSGFDLRENTRDGLAPSFESGGFLKPDQVDLFVDGNYKDALVSPRSAQEYGVATNGAGGHERPESLDLGTGDLATDSVLQELGTGIYVNNLWYLNYSDRPSCRVTGMTRFATLWVENGQVVAPVNVMRFDDTVYRILGEQLVGLTDSRELLLDSGTYERRSTDSARLPGALVDDLKLTL